MKWIFVEVSRNQFISKDGRKETYLCTRGLKVPEEPQPEDKEEEPDMGEDQEVSTKTFRKN